MAISILETFGTVRPDGVLELDRNVTAMTGRVKVRVESIEAPPSVVENLVDFVDRTRRELTAAGHQFMNDDGVTAWIEDLRADADRIDDIYRQTESEERPGQ